MNTAGIDIGSRTIKLVVLENKEIVLSHVTDTTYDPLEVCRGIMQNLDAKRTTVTGYGRHLFKNHWPDSMIITEIKAVAIGARALIPSCRTIIDIGGQDTKAVALNSKGSILKFAMNDKCAAGTGRFMEVMANALSFSPSEFVHAASEASRGEVLSIMCTVFAESEIVSLVARGADRNEIALGIHQAIAKRTSSLVNSIPIVEDTVFVGGGALNSMLTPLIEARIKMPVQVPSNPQTVAAYGAALHANTF